MSFQEALDAAAVKSLLPTSGRTRDLQQLETPLKRRALWSATVESIDSLEAIATGVQSILEGTADQASVSLDLLKVIKSQGYEPAPENVGGLQDVSSFARRSLILETQVAIARGAGWREQGMQADVLDEYPAMELFRASWPRGGPDAERSWANRWARVGGQFYGSRMIALKTDPIWQQLGNPNIFPDALGNDFAPFAFSSGMRTRDIDRDQAESLGLINPGEHLAPNPIDLTNDLAATPTVRADWLQIAIVETGLGYFDAAGVFHFTGGAL
jgi:hypothetical protein